MWDLQSFLWPSSALREGKVNFESVARSMMDRERGTIKPGVAWDLPLGGWKVAEYLVRGRQMDAQMLINIGFAPVWMEFRIGSHILIRARW
jgi:hypothetical protein